MEFKDCPRPKKEPGIQVSHANKRLCQPPLIRPRINPRSSDHKHQRSRGLTHRIAVLTDCIDANTCREYAQRTHTRQLATMDLDPFLFPTLLHSLSVSLRSVQHLTGSLGVTLRIYFAKGIPLTRTYTDLHARTHSYKRLKYRHQHSTRPRTRKRIDTFPLAASVFSVGIFQIRLYFTCA